MSSDADEELAVATSFRFLDLPGELRNTIYRMHLLASDQPVDLMPTNYRSIGPRLRLLRTCRVIHEEAYRVFYGHQAFRLFSTHFRFFHTRRPLLMRLSPRYRAALTSIELRLGPGWTDPPRSWAIVPRLGLKDTTSLRCVTVFVECDPDSSANQVFKGFRRGGFFYTRFCGDLLRKIIAQVPSIEEIRFDRYPSVTRDGPMMMRLTKEALNAEKSVTWCPAWASST